MNEPNTTQVALVMLDGGNDVEQTTKTINHCADMHPWGQVLLFSHKPPETRLKPRVELISIPWLSWPKGNNDFQIYGYTKHLKEDITHILYMHPDGYIINPELWDNDWLNYDYVAPPWKEGMTWYDKNHLVGCGGFALKSKKFLYKMQERVLQVPIYEPMDVYECQAERPWFESQGIKYPPVEVALRFAMEVEYEGWDVDNKSFGFHEVTNTGKRVLL